MLHDCAESQGYCLRKIIHKDPDTGERTVNWACRFNAPWTERGDAIQIGIDKKRDFRRVYPPRDHDHVMMHMPEDLLGWGANVHSDVIVEPHPTKVKHYVVKYVAKPETTTHGFKSTLSASESKRERHVHRYQGTQLHDTGA